MDISEPLPVVFDRYIRESQAVDVAPRTQQIGIRHLNMKGLKTVPWSARTLETVRCDLHGDCMGHLRHTADGSIILPTWCAAESGDYMDARATSCNSLVRGEISTQEYAYAVRTTLMGKKGFIRYHLTGCTPLGSMRGVVVPVWNCEPHHVFVPKLWVSKIKIVRQKGKDGAWSRHMYSSSISEGDWGILVRCPSITETSSQPVMVYFWDKHCIGVNPEMCSLLNMDFDGDEVHVFMAISNQASSEIAALYQIPRSHRFSLDRIRPLLSWETAEVLNTSNFMRAATISTDNMHLNYRDSGLHSLVKYNHDSLQTFTKSFNSNEPVFSFVTNSMLSMKGVITSHHTVSEGYCMGRSVKYLASLLHHTPNNYSIATWDPQGGSVATDTVDEAPLGLPASRLVGRLASLVTQSALDVAKRRVTVRGTLCAELMGAMDSVHTYQFIASSGQLVPTSLMASVSVTLSINTLKTIAKDYPDRLMHILINSLRFLCNVENITYKPIELDQLARVLFLVIRKQPTCPLTTIRGTNILSSIKAPWYHTLIAENISGFEKAVVRDSRPKAGIYDLPACLLTNNWIWHQNNSSPKLFL